MEETYCKRKGYTKLFPNDTQPSCASSTPKKSPRKLSNRSLPSVLNVKPRTFTSQPSLLSGWA
jgi:hypothetical protein